MVQLTIKQQKELSDVLAKFGIHEVRDVHAHGDGHIHSTYLVTTAYAQYIMQKVNTVAFKDVDALMQNIELVTAHLKKKLAQAGVFFFCRKLCIAENNIDNCGIDWPSFLPPCLSPYTYK